MDFQALSDIALVTATLPTSQQTLNNSLVSANSEQVHRAVTSLSSHVCTSLHVSSILGFSGKVEEDKKFVSNHFTTNGKELRYFKSLFREELMTKLDFVVHGQFSIIKNAF